jgi:hypothetical protein
MADYASRIATLKAEQTRLAQRQSELATQRREEIGKLADRIGVLETDDDLLAGLFMELKAAVTSSSPRLAQWRDAGRRFRSAKCERKRGECAAANPSGDRPGRDA